MATPVLQNQNPAAGTTDFGDHFPIVLEVVDPDGNLDASTVKITVGGVVAWFNELPRNGFDVTVTPVTNGYQYSCDMNSMVEKVPTGSCDIAVYAEDLLAEVLDTSYNITLHRTQFFDDHDDDTIGPSWLQWTGNGYLQETSGHLRVGATSGQNQNWWSTVNRQGKAFALALATGQNELIVETDYVAQSGTGDEHGIFGLYLNDDNLYWFDIDNLNLIAYTTEANVWTNRGSYSGNPISLPTRLRMRWDKIGNTIYWEVYNGATWDTVYSKTPTFTPTYGLWYRKSWNAYPAGYYDFDSTHLMALLPAATVTPEDHNEEREEPEQFYDQVTFPANAEQKDGLELTYPVSRRWSPDIASGYIPRWRTPPPRAGFQDDLRFPPQASGGPYSWANVDWSPLVDRGIYVPGRIGDRPKAGFQDLVDIKHADPVDFNYLVPSTDSEGHAHLLSAYVTRGHYYRSSGAGEAWDTPTLNNFTGYAKDGTHYTNGVQDVGPVIAPWSSEAASADRSSRPDFPNEVLIVCAQTEVVIYDMDDFVLSGYLDVWMRFKTGNYYMVGNGNNIHNEVIMKNGVLYLCFDSGGTTNGGSFAIDFKQDGSQNFIHLIRPDNAYRALAGKNITNRHTTSWWTTSGAGSYTTNNEDVYHMDIYQNPNDPLDIWMLHAGEDATEFLHYYNNVLQSWNQENVTDVFNIGNIRDAIFDQQGMCWVAEENRVWCWYYDYQNKNGPAKPFHSGSLANYASRTRKYPKVTLPDGTSINSLKSGREYLYVGTSVGVYMINKRTLAWHLAYTIVGGGGTGRRNTSTADGEKIPGKKAGVQPIKLIQGSKTDFLIIPTYIRGGVVMIRTLDDVVMYSKDYTQLTEETMRCHIQCPQ